MALFWRWASLPIIILLGLGDVGCSLKCFSENRRDRQEEKSSSSSSSSSSFLFSLLTSPSSTSLSPPPSSPPSFGFESCSYFPVSGDPEVCFSRLVVHNNVTVDGRRVRGCEAVSQLGVPEFLEPDFNLTGEPVCAEVYPKFEDFGGAGHRRIQNNGELDEEEDVEEEVVCVCNEDLCNYSGARREELFNLQAVMAAATGATASTMMTTTLATTMTTTTMVARGRAAAAAAIPPVILQAVAQMAFSLAKGI